MKDLTLVCNSHIDPVWLWPWEEGVSATLSTFRAAAELCEEFDAFVFCHNEAILYMWVEEYEPSLFARIQALVRAGRWHIMGGWFLQPDCNLPSGESLVRQILVGKRYFADRFGVEPTVAINFDPFGHTRGLVQILAKSGYVGYLFCRPDAASLLLPSDDFVWVGHDGSTVLAHRSEEHYNSERGKSGEKVERWLATHPGREHGLLLWGVGNHGGGASRADLQAIAEIQAGASERAIRHGRPEDYFDALDPATLPRHHGDLNAWAVGCYTSMATVKHAHLRLERSLFVTEAMLASAAIQRVMPYPRPELQAAIEDLLFCQFHDVLPGEGVREVERQALDRLGHGLEIVSRLRARAFFTLLGSSRRADEGEYPIFVHNHHPFEVEDLVECEFQPPEPNLDRRVFWQPELTTAAGVRVPLQLEKESCNIQADQRKRLVFRARLAPSSTTRFSCRLVAVPREGESRLPPVHDTLASSSGSLALGSSSGLLAPASSSGSLALASSSGSLALASDRASVAIDTSTGLLAGFHVGDVEVLRAPAFRPLVMRDSADPWGMKVHAFRDQVGEFALMSPGAAAAFAGVALPELAPVRVIEGGPVRTVVEALLEFNRSALVLRYKVPRHGSRLEVEAIVTWTERDRFLKLSIPIGLDQASVRARTAYGVDQVSRQEVELVGHRWLAVTDGGLRDAVTIVTDSTYGFDWTPGELRLSLLRAPAYAGHPVDEVTPIVRQDRYEPREDQQVHVFRFWIDAGRATDRLAAIDREAAVLTEGLMALSVFPGGTERAVERAVVLEDDVVRLAAMKLAEDGERLVLRLFEPTGERRQTRVRVPPLGLAFDVRLGPFELKTLAIDLATRSVAETDLLERPWSACDAPPGGLR